MNWTDEYREIVEFYYWEPQHIGRAGGVKTFSGADKMYSHVNAIEVSLNHILNIFFSLYPIEKLPLLGADESHIMMSAWELELAQRQQKNITQPDIFFQGNSSNIALELKTGTKSSLEQVLKYITFNDNLGDNQNKKFKLIYLTPHSDISKIFKEKYPDSVSLHAALKIHTRKEVAVEFITYADLYNSLLGLKSDHKVEDRLVTGLLKYLNSRPDLKITR